MRVHLAALATALTFGIAAAPAAAQLLHAPILARPVFGTTFGLPSEAPSACHHSALNCARQAAYYGGAARALPLYQLAAQRGSKDAMREIGLIYLHGQAGLRADPAQAMGWFYEAALRNDAPSMYMLSHAFADGVGVDRDPALARFWLERAAAHDYGAAREELRTHS